MTEVLDPIEHRKAIAKTYPELLDRVCRPDDFCTSEEDLKGFVDSLRSKSYTCRDQIHSPAHAEALDRFQLQLLSVVKRQQLDEILRQIQADIAQLPHVWLYRRYDDNWLVTRVALEEDCDRPGALTCAEEKMAEIQTEGMAVHLLNLFSHPDKPTPSPKYDTLPDAFELEDDDETVDIWYQAETPEPDEDDEEIEVPEAECLGWVDTELMGHLLCEAMAGYHH